MRKTASLLIASGIAAAITLGLPVSAVTAASAAVSAPSALAHPVCNGGGCIGHDPRVYGCPIARTTEHGNGFATVWGRFSARGNCYAKWARGQLTLQSLRNHDTMDVAIATNDGTEFMCYPGPSDTGQSKEYCNGNYGGPSIAFTDMVYGGKSAIAIVYVYNVRGRQINQITVPI